MKTHHINFKKMDENDLTLLHRWFQIPHVLKWYAEDKKYSLEEIREKYLPRINDTSIPNFIIYDQGKPVGYIQFYRLTDYLPEGMVYNHPLVNDTGASFKLDELVGIDLFIADKDYLHTGFSNETLALFIDTYLKEKFKAVLVDPTKQNIIAIKFYEKNGFKHMMSLDDKHDLMIMDISNE